MGANHAEEEPVLPRHGGSSPPGGGGGGSPCPGGVKACAMFLCWCLGAAVVVYMLKLAWTLNEYMIEPEYSVAITAVSGLSPAADLQRGGKELLVSPVFNLTVGVASRSALRGGCVGPGTAIDVSYSVRRLPMAGGRAPEMCAGPKETIEPRPAVARGHDVAVPGFLVDRLAEDMRRGEAVFEVKLMGLEDGGYWKVVTCLLRVGDAPAAALKPCTVSYIGNMLEHSYRSQVIPATFHAQPQTPVARPEDS
ncbi:hypothetical protein ACP70R_026639 [Stipagrostis hirtigluma subsp. patula]